MNTPTLEKDDIQGLIARGYGKLHSARFVLLKIIDPVATKSYLQHIVSEINTVGVSPDDVALQIAFTSKGLKKIGLPEGAYRTFSREFLEGMDEPFRALILGDQNENDPKKWVWGGPQNDEVHLMILCYARNDQYLDGWFNNSNNDFVANGMYVILKQETNDNMPGRKEHFGFRDGISNPSLNGFGGTPIAENLSPGEFVLGYPDEYKVISDRPVVDPKNDPKNILPICEDPANKGMKDLGKNGSYLIYRQMSQHVYRFWKYLADNSKEEGSTPIESAIKLGAKMVGRWPGGAPMATSPNFDDPTKKEETKFMYADVDPVGMGCPMGAHVRRVNPRDQLITRSTDASTEMIRKHRLIRRGRSYGPGCVEDMEPAKVLAKGDDGETRGLHFICLSADISRQFEFVQNAWVKSPTFAGLLNDADPIIAARDGADGHLDNQFTCPALPLRRKYKDMPQFVNVIGGAYFFLPGIKALKYIANC